MSFKREDFLDNKYTKWYFQLVEHRIKNQHPKPHPDGITIYTHHIIPKCKSIGGHKKDPSNLVLFTHREHLLAHWLLTKMLKGRQRSDMQWSFIYLVFGVDAITKKKFTGITSTVYSIAKRLRLSIASGESHPGFVQEHAQLMDIIQDYKTGVSFKEMKNSYGIGDGIIKRLILSFLGEDEFNKLREARKIITSQNSKRTIQTDQETNERILSSFIENRNTLSQLSKQYGYKKWYISSVLKRLLGSDKYLEILQENVILFLSSSQKGKQYHGTPVFDFLLKNKNEILEMYYSGCSRKTITNKYPCSEGTLTKFLEFLLGQDKVRSIDLNNRRLRGNNSVIIMNEKKRRKQNGYD